MIFIFFFKFPIHLFCFSLMENVYVYPCSLHPIGRLHINLSLQPSFISIQTISFPICLTIINHMPHDNFVYVVLSSSSFFLLTLELLSPDDPVRPSVRSSVRLSLSSDIDSVLCQSLFFHKHRK